MKVNIRILILPLVLAFIIPLFQNCGQSELATNSSSYSESSDSPFPGGSSGAPGGSGNGSIRTIEPKVCTSEPLVLIAGNQYMTNAIGSFTVPVLVTFDTATKKSKVEFPKSHYMYPSNSNPGNGQGLYGYDLSVAYDKWAQPHFIGRESYATRTQNCYFKSYVWQSMTTFEEVFVNSNSQLNTPYIVPHAIVSTVILGSQVYSAINFIGTDDNSACTQTVSSIKPTIPALYNHTTKTVSFLPVATSREFVKDLIVEDDKLVVIGNTQAGLPIIWKDGKRLEVASHSSGYSKFDTSLGNYFFAGFSTGTVEKSLVVWKNGALKNSTPLAGQVTFIGFDAELNNTYTLIRESTANRLYYLINEKTEVTVETSSFLACSGIDIKSFNNKVYVLGSCTHPNRSRSFVVWVDGKLTEMLHTANIQNTGTARLNVGCSTKEGFYTDLDASN